jgi:hypothetical protein
MSTSWDLHRLGIDLIGLAAGALVLSTFYMKCMVRLRYLALLSNVTFATYGLLLGLWPIVLLHVLLVPVNALRLRQLRAAQRRPTPPGAAAEDGRYRLPGRQGGAGTAAPRSADWPSRGRRSSIEHRSFGLDVADSTTAARLPPPAPAPYTSLCAGVVQR